MRQVIALLLFLITSHVGAGDLAPEIQIALYPYYHRPAVAWRITILPDGTVRAEQSARPVKIVKEVDLEELEWVPVSQRAISAKKLAVLLRQLRRLHLETVAGHYSAQYSFLDPDEEVMSERIVTHGATYSLRIYLDGLSVDTNVYAPLSALEWEKPPHPDQSEIRKIVAAWYCVLRAVGPVDDIKAEDLRPYLK